MSTLTSFEECDLVLTKCLQVAHEVYQFHRSRSSASHLHGRYSYYSTCRHHLATTMSRAKELGPYSTGSSGSINSTIEKQTQQQQQPLPLLVKANRHFADDFERDCAFILHQNINNHNVAAVAANDHGNETEEETPIPVVVLREAALPCDPTATTAGRGTVPCLLYRWRDPKCARLFHRVMQRCLDESVQLMLPPPFHAAGGGFPCSKIAYQGAVVSVVILPPLVQREAIASSTATASTSAPSITGCGAFALKTFAAALSPMLYPSTLDLHVKNAPSVFAIPAALLLPAVSAYAAGGAGSNDVLLLPDKISVLSQIVSQKREERNQQHHQQEYHLLLRPELEKYITEEENNNNDTCREGDGTTTMTSTGVIISRTLDKAARRVALDLLIHFERQILLSSSTSSQQNQNNHKNDESITSIVNVSLAKNEISKIFHRQGVNLKLMYLVSCHLESILAISENENHSKNQNVTSDSISCSKLALGAEMIARTIKSMVRKRTETTQSPPENNNHNSNNKNDEATSNFLSILQNVFNDFFTDRIFYRELLQPTMRKKFGCPDGFFVDREKLTSLIGGVAALVARGLGCGLEEDMKTFIIYKPATSDSEENNTQNEEEQEYPTPAGSSSVFFSPQNLGKVTSSGICPDLTFLTSLLSPANEIHQMQQQQQNGSPNRNNNNHGDTNSSASASYLFVHPTSTMAQLTASMSPRNPICEQPDDASNSNVTGVNAVLCFLEAARILKFCFCETMKFRGSDGNYQKQSDTINNSNNDKYSSTASCNVSGLSIVLSELGHRMRRGGGGLGGGNSSFNHSMNNNNNTSNMSASSSRGSSSRLKRCLAVWLLSLLGGCFSSVANQQQNIIQNNSRNTSSSPAVVNLPSLCRNLVSEFVVTFRSTSSSSSSSSNSFELVSSLLCSINLMKILTEDFNFSSSSGTNDKNTQNNNIPNNFYYYYSTFSQHEKSEIISNVLADLLAFAARIGKLLPPPSSTNSSCFYYYPTSPFLLYGKPSSNETNHSENNNNNNNNLLLSHTFFQCLETCSKIIESLVSTTSTTTSNSPLVSKQNNSSVSSHSQQRGHTSDISMSLNNSSSSASTFSSKDMLTLLAPGFCGYIWNILLWNLQGVAVVETDATSTSDHTKNNKSNSPNRHNNSHNNDSCSFISSQLLRPSPAGYVKSNDNNDDTNFWALGFDIVFFQPLFSQKIPTLVKRSKETNFSFQSIMDSTLQNNSNVRNGFNHQQQQDNGNNTLVPPASSWWLDAALLALTTTFPQLVHLATNKKSDYCNELLTRVIIILVGVFTNSANSNHHLNSGIAVLASLLDPQAAKIFPALIQSNANNNHDADVNFGKISEIIENARNMMAEHSSGGEKILTPRQRQQYFQQKQHHTNINNNQTHNDPYRALLSESLRIILLTSSQLPVESSNAVKYNRFVPVSMTSQNVAAFKTVLDLFSSSPKNENNNKNISSSRNGNHQFSPTHKGNMMMTLASTRSHSGNRNNNSSVADESSSRVVTKPIHEKVRDLLVEYTETLASSLPTHMSNFGESLFGLWNFYFKKKDVILASSHNTTNNNNNNVNSDANEILYEISKWRRSNFTSDDNHDAQEEADENTHRESHKNQKSLSQLHQDATQEELTDRMVIESEESFDRKRIRNQIAECTESTLRQLAADASDQERLYAALRIQHAQQLRVARSEAVQTVQKKKRSLLIQQQQQQQQQPRSEGATGTGTTGDRVLDEERTYAALRLQALQRQRSAKEVAAGRRGMLVSARNVVERDGFDGEREFATLKLQGAMRQSLARRRVAALREGRRRADEEAYVRDSPKHDNWHGDMMDEEIEKEREIQEENVEEATEEDLEEQQRAALKLQSLQRQRMAKQRVVSMKQEQEQKQQQQREVNNINAAHRALEEATEEVSRAEIEQKQAEQVAGFRRLLKLLITQEQRQTAAAAAAAAAQYSSDDEDTKNNNNANDEDGDQTGAVLRIQSAQRQRAAKAKVSNMRALKGQAQRTNEIFEGEEKVARDDIRLEEASEAAKHRMLMNLLKKNPELMMPSSKNNATQKSSTKTGSDDDDDNGENKMNNNNTNNANDISVTSRKEDDQDEKHQNPSSWSYMRHEQNEHVSRSRERALSEPRQRQQQERNQTQDEELLSEADRLADLQRRVADFEKERHATSEAKQRNDLQKMMRALEGEKQFHRDVLELLDIEGEMRRSIEDCERRMKRFMRLPSV